MMIVEPVIVVGAGGHARVVADALLCAGVTVIGFTDADSGAQGRSWFGLPMLGNDDVLERYREQSVLLANGIGMIDASVPSLRQRVQTTLQARGWDFTTVCHPSAIVSPRARLDTGVQVFAGSVVQAGAVLGTGTIVNSRAVVEHDVHIGVWSHIAPGAVICGDVRIGDHTMIGAGATIRQGLRISDRCLIGIGAAVVTDLKGPATMVGVPARLIPLKK